MEKNPRSASPSVSSESKDGLRAPANTQSPTPQPSPPASPKPISPAKAWLLSISAMPEEPFQLSSPPPSPSSTSQPANINLPSFANDFFEVRTSTKGGLGAFAVADIPNDTIIMAEEPLFRAEPVQIFWKYEALSDEQKKEYKTLSCWYGVEDHKIQAIFTTNRYVKLECLTIDGTLTDRILIGLKPAKVEVVSFSSLLALTTLVTHFQPAPTDGKSPSILYHLQP